MAAFVISKMFNLRGDRVKIKIVKSIYMYINSQLHHTNIQNDFKIPDFNLFID